MAAGKVKLKIFNDGTSRADVPWIVRALEREYRIKAINAGRLELKSDCYNSDRHQYEGEAILDYLCSTGNGPCLFVIKKDMYTDGMNFIFGLCRPGICAVLSLARLKSRPLMNKEAVHEVGHLLGLEHCSNRCVMKFSNSLAEAKDKPGHLCEACRNKLDLIAK